MKYKLKTEKKQKFFALLKPNFLKKLKWFNFKMVS